MNVLDQVCHCGEHSYNIYNSFDITCLSVCFVQSVSVSQHCYNMFHTIQNHTLYKEPIVFALTVAKQYTEIHNEVAI